MDLSFTNLDKIYAVFILLLLLSLLSSLLLPLLLILLLMSKTRRVITVFCQTPTYAISISLIIEIHKNNIDTFTCYVNHNPTNKSLDSLASNSFIPYILQPTQLTSHSKTLIDNIFSNIISPEEISSNLTSTISDHLPQFMIVPNVFCNPPSNKANIFERGWSNFGQENFIFDYFPIDWNVILKLHNQNVDYSTESFLNKINSLKSNYALLKKINKYKLRLQSKSWVTTALQKSISIKNKFD